MEGNENYSDFLQEELRKVEEKIFSLETEFLEETSQQGNILKGWEGYTILKNIKNEICSAHKKTKFNQKERLFSQSSATVPEILSTYNNSQLKVNHRISNSRNSKKYGKPSLYRSKRLNQKRNQLNEEIMKSDNGSELSSFLINDLDFEEYITESSPLSWKNDRKNKYIRKRR